MTNRNVKSLFAALIVPFVITVMSQAVSAHLETVVSGIWPAAGSGFAHQLPMASRFMVKNFAAAMAQCLL